MTTNQPLSLFISSKMAELAPERRAIQAALSQFAMYGWLWEKDAGARPEPIDSTYLKEVEACDLYIGLFWLGYGPYTIEEYEHARKHHKKCLIYEKYIDTDKRDPQLQTFLATIQQVKNPDGLTVCRFETSKQLAQQVNRDVLRLLTTTFRESRQQPTAPSGKRWHPPQPPVFDKDFVGRQDERDELITHLSAGQNVAITGKTTSAALQGMGGIGKTYLAHKLAMDMQRTFPAGVLWIDLGPQVTDESSAQIPLRKLASYIPDYVLPADQLHPEMVAALIEEIIHEPLLVVFDDVWHQLPLRFLARALPANAVRLVTTRYANIAQTLGGKMVRLDRLTPADGLALLEDRLDCQGETAYRADLEQLVSLLDGHALALDIAAALIKKRPARELAVHMVLENLRQGTGQGKLNTLKLPPSEERDENLERSLALSYERMNATQQAHFRALGVFAPEAPISVAAVSAVWNMDNLHDAQNALLELVDLALLSEILVADDISYRQHGMLRVYARALLETTGELHNASRAHAQYYTDLAWQAETTRPKGYPLLEQHILNLQATLEWTDDHEPELFVYLMDGVEQFLRLRGQIALLEAYLPKAEAAAAALGNRGRQANLLQSLGDLERRLGNIDQARAHYDAALPLFQAERDRLGEANVYMSLGDMFLAQENRSQARTYYELALPLFVAERDPQGQANTLIDLGRVRFELGEHEQGIRDVQQAAELFHLVQDEQWAHRAEQYLAGMRSKLEQSGANIENLSGEAALLEAFINVESPKAMFELVQQNPQLLTDTWFTTIEELIAGQTDEGAKLHLSERLDVLKQIRQDVEEQASNRSNEVRILDEFARADWDKRRQLLHEQADILLSEQIELLFDLLVQQTEADTDTIQALEALRTLLRRCRSWGIDPVWYFELYMRLGDNIDIPAKFEPAVMHIATQLSRLNEDNTALEQAVRAMQTLLSSVTSETPGLFRAALLRDLAGTTGALPPIHPLRNMDQVEAYYREAIPLYHAADRPISVAFTQRSLGDLLSEQGRYEEALAPLQAASQGLQEHEQYRDDTVWTLSVYANALDKLGRLDEALASYAEAISLQPDTSPLLRNRAETFIHARRLEEAEADLARAIVLDRNEDSPYLWYRRAQLAIARGNALLADQMMDEVTKREPSFDVRLEQTQSAWLKDDLNTAQDVLQQAFAQANQGDRAAMLRDMQLLFSEHPGSTGNDKLKSAMMKFQV